MNISTDIKTWAGFGIIVALLLLTALPMYRDPLNLRRHPDFRCTRMAAVVYQEGKNPYNTANYPPLPPGPDIVWLPQFYPPFILTQAFRPFTWISEGTAVRVYVTLKLLASCALMFFWARIFNAPEGPRRWALFLLTIFAFDGSLMMDIRMGNLSTFEQFFVWLGFYFYTRGKPGLFAAAIVAASSAKFVLIPLLGVLLMRFNKREMICFALGCLAFCAYLVLNALVWPQLFRDEFHKLSGGPFDHGEINPATWPFILDVIDWVRLKTGVHIPGILPTGIFAVVFLAAFAISLAMTMALRKHDSPPATMWRICLICLFYAIVVPRLRNYSYILLIGPAFFVVSSASWISSFWPFCLLLVMFSYRAYVTLGIILAPFYHALLEYYPLWLAWGLWVLCCVTIWRQYRNRAAIGF